MKIRVEFLAQARVAAECDGVDLELKAKTTVADAIRRAVDMLNHAPALQSMVLTSSQQLHPWLMITVDDQAILDPENQLLHTDAVLGLMPPISGG